MIQETSLQALESVQPVTAAKEVIFDVIAKHPEGIIAEDVEIYLEFGRSTVTARIRDLVLSKRVKDSGLRGATSSGRSAIKWVVDNTPAVAMAA